MQYSRLSATLRHPWVFALLAGAATGLIVLGVGGRVVMRLVAVHNGQTPGWSIGGTVTVLFMGVVSGVGGAAIRAAAAVWLPRRTPTAVASTIFAIACLLLTLRGLHPVDTTRLVFFLPLTVTYVVAFEVLWRRRPRAATGDDGVESTAVGVYSKPHA